MTLTLTMTQEEYDTILAALRCYQMCVEGSLWEADTVQKIATNEYSHPALTPEEIDVMVARLQHGAPGCVECGGSGILAPVTPSCQLPSGSLDRFAIVERCDTCEKYEDDWQAANFLSSHVRTIYCKDGGSHIAIPKEDLP